GAAHAAPAGPRDAQARNGTAPGGSVRPAAVRGAEVGSPPASGAHPPQTKVMIHSMANRLVGRLPGVSRVNAKMGGGAPAQQHQHAAHEQAHGTAPRPADLIPEVKHTIAVSSGKGGVGKSTVAVNLPLALQATGAHLGIIDSP